MKNELDKQLIDALKTKQPHSEWKNAKDIVASDYIDSQFLQPKEAEEIDLPDGFGEEEFLERFNKAIGRKSKI